jgi:hypothetical protein
VYSGPIFIAYGRVTTNANQKLHCLMALNFVESPDGGMEESISNDCTVRTGMGSNHVKETVERISKAEPFMKIGIGSIVKK